MNISGIRPISGYDSPSFNTNRTFGQYDVAKLHKPATEAVTKSKISSLRSLSQAQKAVDVMKRDSVLHKYQKFVGERNSSDFIGRGVKENFTL